MPGDIAQPDSAAAVTTATAAAHRPYAHAEAVRFPPQAIAFRPCVMAPSTASGLAKKSALCTIALTPQFQISLAATCQVPIAMSRRFLVIVLLPCIAVLADAVCAQTPPIIGRTGHADDTASHANRNGMAYPQFAYPPAGLRPATPAPAAHHRAAVEPSPAAADPYAFGGWNNLSYDPPSLDQPWSARGPADQLPQPGQ